MSEEYLTEQDLREFGSGEDSQQALLQGAFGVELPIDPRAALEKPSVPKRSAKEDEAGWRHVITNSTVKTHTGPQTREATVNAMRDFLDEHPRLDRPLTKEDEVLGRPLDPDKVEY